MFRIITVLFLFTAINFNGISQEEKPLLIGINFAPINGKSLEIGIEKSLNPSITFAAIAGFTIDPNSKFITSEYSHRYMDYSKKNGVFIKLESRIHFREDYTKFSPFVGLIVVNSLINEKGKQKRSTLPESEIKNGYNLSLGLTTGLTFIISKKTSLDFGFQSGRDIINNQLNKYDYLPGSGIQYEIGTGSISFYSFDFRVQGIIRLKYQIN